MSSCLPTNFSLEYEELHQQGPSTSQQFTAPQIPGHSLNVMVSNTPTFPNHQGYHAANSYYLNNYRGFVMDPQTNYATNEYGECDDLSEKGEQENDYITVHGEYTTQYPYYYQQGSPMYFGNYVPQGAMYPVASETEAIYPYHSNEIYNAHGNIYRTSVENLPRDFSQSPVMAVAERIVPNAPRSTSGSPIQKPMVLIKFLKTKLDDNHEHCIEWTDRSRKIFRIRSKEKLAELWDMNKNKIDDRKSFHDRLRRAFDHNESKGLLRGINKRHGGEHPEFQFIEC